MRVFVVTGISSGLGERIVKELMKNKEYIIGIARSFTEQQKEDFKTDSDKLQMLKCDLSNLSDVTGLTVKLKKLLIGKFDEVIFINNAGTIEPITKVGDFDDLSDVTHHINVNYVSPMIVINGLVGVLQKNMNLQILNITSGAAERPIEGWSLYCSTKKATKMFLDVLNEENNKVTIRHIDPGVMNTKMQQDIRESKVEDFPAVQQFKNYKEDGLLLEVNDVVIKVLEGYVY